MKALLALAFICAVTVAAQAQDMTVYTNARVYTMDADQPWASAFTVDGDRFSFVGSAADATLHAGSKATVVDLGGRVVLPGLIDAHAHPGLVAMSGDLSVVDGVTPALRSSKVA